MAIIFEPENHLYTSINADDITWVSVTTLLSQFKEPFEGKAIAERSARSKKSKWYGMPVEEIQLAWKNEADRACGLGNFYHDQREQDLLGCKTIYRHGKELPVIHPMYDELNRKIAGSQKLSDGIYPEHMVYLKSLGICGQSDLVEVADNQVHITDYKTNKEIKESSYVNYEGISKKMLAPVSHLDDCNLIHYNLQLSIYMFMILKHNPRLKPGSLTIHHVKFETAGEDQYGFPISALDENGDPILKEIIPYQLPYLKNEVMAIMKWCEQNKGKIKKKH